MATFRNLAIGILKLSGASNIAAASRRHARDATRALTTQPHPGITEMDITPLCRGPALRKLL
jgi:hypothetical protein